MWKNRKNHYRRSKGGNNIEEYYFFWLEKLQSINEDINIELYKDLIKKYSNIEDIFNKIEFSDVHYNEEIFILFKDNKIKQYTLNNYNYLKDKNVKFVTIENINFPYKIYNDNYIPFCICYNGNIRLNRKNVYLYYEDYYTNYAKGILKYFSKIILNSDATPISTLLENGITNIIGIEKYINCNNIINNNVVIYQDEREVFYLIDLVIIIEARYSKKIANFTNSILDTGREIYVVPSNIFRKNSFFSNYLIKQGADIILNKNDLIYIVSKIC